ncbi:polyprenyl synthetase family protein [Streptomyces roseifaciens]|uniref:polyprenyl synthetase family protein n=1 Tax=Streptomyces roseifaciens TaxID=1488406 RepID=UPI000717E3FF|nr:polyprenyl synthetase family protein [Streptomyces roseifaciens]
MNKHAAQAPPSPSATDSGESVREDLPHPDRPVERWSVNASVRTAGGEEHSLSAQFLCRRPGAGGGTGTARPGGGADRPAGHTVIWSHTDHATGGRTTESWLDEAALAEARSAFEDASAWDPHVRRAVLDALAGGRPLLPDRLLHAPVRLAAHRLDLDFGGVATLTRHPGGSYGLTVAGDAGGFALTLGPGKPPLPLRAGDETEAPGALSSSCLPRMTAEGTVSASGREPVRVTGEAWLEHSYGTCPEGAHRPGGAETAWMRVQVQLDNGWDVALLRTSLVEETTGTEPLPSARQPLDDGDPDPSDPPDVLDALDAPALQERPDRPDRPMATHTTQAQHTVCAVSGPDGHGRQATAELWTTRRWDSSVTMNSYPVATRLRIPEAGGLDVRLVASPYAQEVSSMSLGRAFWHGRCRVEGTMGGRPVGGHARVEFVPPNTISDLEDFMRRIGRITRAEVRRFYPDTADPRVLGTLAGLEGHVPLDEASSRGVHAGLVLPVRHLADLGGKSWRSFASACVMALFSEDADRYRPLMAVTELLHTGSLIVDDVEDASPMRRGGPTVHEVFGAATAINAGTAAYFVFDRVADDILPDDPALRLRVHRAYLRALRAGHAGQALDITGHEQAMDTAVTTGDASVLLQRLHSTHRLKSGLPVRMFAEVSALLTGAGEAETAAIGAYFEALGVAYQISDDVADLRGIGTVRHGGRRRAAKRVAEDLLNGKVTVPLAHAVPLLPPDRLRAVWEAVRGGRATPQMAEAVAAVLAECGAVDAARAHARALLEEAWPALDRALPPTMPKAILRGLGWYAAEREDDVPDPAADGRPPAPRKPLHLTGDRV